MKGNIVIVGACGYWGSIMIRAAIELFGSDRVVAVDIDQSGLERLVTKLTANNYLNNQDDLSYNTDLDVALEDTNNCYFVIVTPPQHHYEIAMKILARKRNIMTTKPIALTSRDAEEIGAYAAQQNVVAMVDHTFLYHPAIKSMVKLVKSGVIGTPKTYYAEWLSRGKIQETADVLWDLAPHPLSILLEFWAFPISVSCKIHDELDGLATEASIFLTEVRTGNSAIIHVSWMDGDKSRKFKIRGSHHSVIFDDAKDLTSKLYLAGGKISGNTLLGEGYKNPVADIDYPGQKLLEFDWEEPLKDELRDFINSTQHTEGVYAIGKGIACVKLIEAAHLSLERKTEVTCN